MYSMDRKIDLSIVESSYLEIKPAFWVTFTFIAFSITCSPYTIILV